MALRMESNSFGQLPHTKFLAKGVMCLFCFTLIKNIVPTAEVYNLFSELSSLTSLFCLRRCQIQ